MPKKKTGGAKKIGIGFGLFFVIIAGFYLIYISDTSSPTETTIIIDSKEKFLAQFPMPVLENTMILTDSYAPVSSPDFFDFVDGRGNGIEDRYRFSQYQFEVKYCRKGSIEHEDEELVYCFFETDCTDVKLSNEETGNVLDAKRFIRIKGIYSGEDDGISKRKERLGEDELIYKTKLTLLDFDFNAIYANDYGKYAACGSGFDENKLGYWSR